MTPNEEELRKALAPFARYAVQVLETGRNPDEIVLADCGNKQEAAIRVGHFIAAVDALGDLE
jgi:hypothetical protein